MGSDCILPLSCNELRRPYSSSLFLGIRRVRLGACNGNHHGHVLHSTRATPYSTHILDIVCGLQRSGRTAFLRSAFQQVHREPMETLMIATGGLTLLLSILSWFCYPDNPGKARFLTNKEKVQVIQRVHEATRSSIEQKTFKKHHFYEALSDPITWLFALVSFCLNLANNLAFQMSILLLSLGVGNLGSTLITVASGGFAVSVAIVASLLLRFFPGYSAWWATLWVLPAIAGSIGMVALAWDKTIPLLACLLLGVTTWGMTYIISFVWASSSSAGYTKKLTRNALFMMGYGISNIISPQLWKSGGPRYYGTWIAQTVVSFVLTPCFLLIIRFILVRRNKERRVWIEEQAALGNFGEGYVEEIDADGNVVKTKVDISVLDLSDLENKFFIYPL